MDRILRRLAEARPFDLPPRQHPRAGRRLLLIPATATATAVAAVAGVFVAVNALAPTALQQQQQQQQEQQPVNPPEARVTDARQLLLAAAQNTESGQEGTGRYWLRKSEIGVIYDAGTYNIMTRETLDLWYPMSTQDSKVVNCQQKLGAQPLTEADRAAWVAAGSPASLTAKSTWLDLHQTELTTTPGDMICRSKPFHGQGMFGVGDVMLSLEQLRALPTDPVQLRETLQRHGPDIDAQRLIFAAMDILIRVPAPPAVRAAAYRMLAESPGIMLADNVKDQLGRGGSAVDYPFSRPDSGSWRLRLIIDLKTGQPLSEEFHHASAGRLSSFSAMTEYTFTDQAPPPSA